MEKAGPIFLIGASRSGTTMLRLMLNQHPLIRIPSEAWFIGDLIDKLPLEGPLSPAHLEKAFQLTLSHDRWKDWHCSDEKLRTTILSMENGTLSELIDRLFRNCSGMGVKPYWGEKSPRHSYYVHALNALFPNARFIHLVRDGRDVAASLLGRGWYEGSVRRCAMCWNGMVEAAMRAEKFGPERYRQIHFEDLIQQPEEVMRDICQYLKVEYTPELLAYHSAFEQEIEDREKGIHEKLERPPDVAEIGKWKRLKFWQRLIIESIIGENLRRTGYEVDHSWWLAWAKTPCRAWCWGYQKAREGMTKFRWIGTAGLLEGLSMLAQN